MKGHSKVILLVAIVVFLLLAGCTRQSTTNNAVNLPTSTGEAEFPFTTPSGNGGVTDFGTQTAIARTPQVVILTETPVAGAPEATQPAQPTQAPADAGGGVSPTQAPQPAAPAVNTPVVERPQTYTLQKGEWPICIARRYNLDLGTFFSLNGLSMESRPAAGRTLQIPSTGSWSSNYGSRSLQAHPTSYTVSAGESVYSIACKFGDVSPEAILAVNSLASAADVKAGMTLQIP
jgi:LysM repeat protein